MIFIGDPSYKQSNPVMIINEELLFQWTQALQLRASNFEHDFLDSPGIFLDPAALRHYTRVVSTGGVHKLKIHSTGAGEYLCRQKPHEKRRWLDNQLPIEISTCQLGQVYRASKFN
jgi:hypothetical protein